MPLHKNGYIYGFSTLIKRRLVSPKLLWKLVAREISGYQKSLDTETLIKRKASTKMVQSLD